MELPETIGLTEVPVARRNPTSPEQFLHQLIAPVEVRRAAIETGFVKRVRKIDPVAFLVSTVLALCGRGGQSLAEMRRNFATRTGVRVARSAFWKRFTPAFDALVSWLLERLQARAAERKPICRGVLAPFRDVVAVDATVVPVDESLAGTWKGTRTASVPAAVKVHTRVRAVTGELLKHRITAEAYSEAKAFGLDWSDAGKLFLFDRGYPSASLWWRIHRVGGFFLTRLPATYRPEIVAVNRRHRGRARGLVGQLLSTAVDGLKRAVLDVDCRFRVHVRGYARRRGRWEDQPFRVVGLWDVEERKYHFYVTNLRPEQTAAEDLRDLYRLRWEVETFYKTAKGGLGLDELPSAQPHIVQTLIRAALIRASIAMQAKAEAEPSVPAGRWIQPKTWTSVWATVLDNLVAALVAPSRRKSPGWAFLAVLAMDDNLNRPPTRWRCNQEPRVESESSLNSAA